MSTNNVGIQLTLDGASAVTGGTRQVTNELNLLEGAAGKVGEAFKGIAAAAAAGLSIRAFIQAADAVTVLNNQLKLATGSTQAATQAYAALFDIAQRSRVSFTELGGTFASISRAGEALGVSQQRLLGVTEAISNAVAISGGSAESAKASLIQLSQGLASGTLRGDELNSVMEQTPRLAKALADGLGVSTGELRKLGEQGAITADKVIKALESQSKVLSGEVKDSVVTVGQAFTQLSNSATKLVGDMDAASGISNTVAKAMQSLAGALGSAGATIKEHETAFRFIAGTLAGSAVAAGLYITAGGIAAIWAAVTLGGSVVVTAALVTLGAVIGLAATAGSEVSKSETVLKASLQNINNAIAVAEKERNFTLAASLGERKKMLEDELRAKQQAGVIGIGGNGDRELERALAAQQKAAEAGLDTVRATVKTEIGIRTDGAKEMLKINAAFQTAIAAAQAAGNTDQAATLEKERGKLLVLSAQETHQAVKALQDKNNAEAYANAKQALDKQIALIDEGKASKLSALNKEQVLIKSARDTDLISEQAYIAKKAAMDQAANQAHAQSVADTLKATQAAGIDPKQKAAEEQKLNAELKKLADERYTIALEFGAALSLLEYKEVDGQRKALEVDIDALRKSNDALKLHNEEIGLTVYALNKLILARLDNSISTLEDAVNVGLGMKAHGLTVETLDLEIEKLKELKRQRGLTATGQDKQAGADSAKATFEEWKRGWEETDRIARDAFTGWAENGTSMAEAIGKSLKKALLSAIYEATLKPLVFEVYASIAGNGSAGGNGAGGGGFGGISGLSGLGNAGSAASGFKIMGQYSGLLQAGGTADYLDTVLYKAGNSISAFGDTINTTGTGSVSSFGNSLAANSKTIGAKMETFGNVLSYATAAVSMSEGKWASGILQAIGTYYGGPILGAIGGAVGGWLDKGWGSGYSYQTGSGIMGAAMGGNFSGTNYRDIHHDGNWFNNGNDERQNLGAVSSLTDRILDEGFGSIVKSTADFAKQLGFSADLITSHSEQISLAFSDDAAKNDQAIKDMFLQVEDNFAKVLITGVDLSKRTIDPNRLNERLYSQGRISQEQYDKTALELEGGQAYVDKSKVGKDYTYLMTTEELAANDFSGTLARLATSLTTTNEAFRALGVSLLAVGMDGAEASTQIVDAFGGLDKFAQQTSSYFSNFYSDKERETYTRDSITRQMSAVGISSALPTDRAGYRDLVDAASKKLDTEAGHTTYATLIRLSDAFASITPAAEEAATAAEILAAKVKTAFDTLTKDSANLGVDLLRAQGKSREADFAAMGLTEATASSAVVALYDYNNGIKEQIAVLTQAAAVTASLNSEGVSLQDQYDKLTMTEAEYRDKQIIGLISQQVAIYDNNRALEKNISALNAQASAAAQAASDAKAYASAVLGVTDRLKSEAASLNVQLLTARGDTTGAAAAQRAIDTATGGANGGVMTADQIALYDANQATKDLIESIKLQAQAASNAAAAHKAAAAEQAAAAKQLKDAWKGLTTSLTDEINKIRSEMAGGGSTGQAYLQAQFATLTAQASAGDQGAAGKLASAAEALLSSAKENAASSFDFQLFQAQIANSLQNTVNIVSNKFGLDTLAGTANAASGSKKIRVPKLATGTDYVPQDMLALIHKGEAVVPRAYNPSAGGTSNNQSNAQLREEVRLLRSELRSQNTAIAENSRVMAKVFKRWDADGMPEVRATV